MDDEKKWGPMTVTVGGRNVTAKTVAGKQLLFTRAAAGEGYPSAGQDITEMTDLVSPVRDMDIVDIDDPDTISANGTTTGEAIVTIEVTNKDFPRGFYLSEIGLFAKDPDTGAEVLFGYCCVEEEKKAQYMPRYGGAEPVTFEFGLTVVVEQTKDISAVFCPNPSHVTRRVLNKRLDEVRRENKADKVFLQSQIDLIADAGIRELLTYAEKRLAAK